MSNPTFATGNLTREVGSVIEPFRLVKIADGKIVHNDGNSFPFGAVTEKGVPEGSLPANTIGPRPKIRVHTSQCVVKLETDGTDFKDGAKVYAANDGKVATTGTIAVGLVDRPESGKLVRVHLFHPAVLV